MRKLSRGGKGGRGLVDFGTNDNKNVIKSLKII